MSSTWPAILAAGDLSFVFKDYFKHTSPPLGLLLQGWAPSALLSFQFMEVCTSSYAHINGSPTAQSFIFICILSAPTSPAPA